MNYKFSWNPADKPERAVGQPPRLARKLAEIEGTVRREGLPMKVGAYQASSSVGAAYSGRVSGGVSTQAVSGGRTVQAADSGSAVLNGVDYQVYNAVGDFISLSGDSRLDSYSNLPEQGKRKFMKAIDKLVQGGEVPKDKLDLGDRSPAKEAFLDDYQLYSDRSVNPYGADGKSSD